MVINAYSTLQPLILPEFPHSIAGGQRDLSDLELSPHLAGFIGYVLSTGQGQMTNTLYGVIRHIQRVQHHISIKVEDSELNVFAAWAWEANAIVFLPDGTVRDPSGRVLVSPDPSAIDPQARVPFPQDALQRKAINEEKLAGLGVTVARSLPPVLGVGEGRLRSVAEITRRMTALFAVALQAESLEADKPISMAELEDRLPELSTALSPSEHKFLHQTNPEHQQVTDFLWRYESLSLLQWISGLVEDLPLPMDICDVPKTAKIALAQGSGPLQLRSSAEILDGLDLHYRLHWALRQAKIDGHEAPLGLNSSVVYERHYALNWLVHFENKDWDEIDTPT